ncbi:M3 family metallopeptidase [Alistipes sp. kh20]|uniref:M3 family metallopeptidase n=1 Tax=Alistipes montrealensis TaxID=2834113 RepID=UPI001BCD72DC|nr:M3 family metallopeptidase [Alistipes montrealensis]MBS4766646.1 M3 family metallopeptidase [Alistipes montrealensis]
MKRITALLTLFLAMTFVSCKSGKTVGENPFFSAWETPYGVPPFDKIEPGHFLPALERGMSLHEAEIDAITSNNDAPTFENVILAHDNSGKMLSQVELIFGMLCAAENTPAMQALEEQVMPLMAAHSDKIRLNEKLFERIRAVYDQRAALGLDAEQSRLLEKTYRDFVRAGALLDAEQKARLKAINEELSLTSVKFGQNILAENNNYALELTAADLDGVPVSARDQARDKAEAMGRKGKYVFTLHKPSLIPFLTYASKRELREEIYKAYINRCNNGDQYDNKQLINDFIRLRTEKAHLLGYPSYAAYVVADQMAGTTDAVYGLLEEIWTPALESAKGELSEMEALFKKDFPDGEFASWDWWYYAEKVRKQKYALDEEMLRPYFSLENVQGGIFFLANRLYGITFRPIVVPLYHPDATAYEVLDVDQSHLGVLYFDYFPRDGKSQGAWCGNYVEQTYEDGKRVAPVVSIVCNFTRPVGDTPALLTLDETETLFHEFGHALHFLFHDVKYRGLTEVEGDFVELPSQLMENWAFDSEVLKQYAVHYRSNEVIPKYLVEKLHRSELFNQGFMTTELIASSLSDMDIHSMTEYAPFDPMEFERKSLTEKRGLIPQIEPRYHYPYFSHIFDGGYSAGYYFYTWAEVLDKDTFEAFRESGDLFNKKIADDFRRKVLARGGSEDGMTMYRDFRGKDPDKKAMLRSRGLLDEPEPSDKDAAPAAPEI